MQRLDADSNVYKLIGPVLVKQDQDEAKQNVQKRIDYINTELWVNCTALVMSCFNNNNNNNNNYADNF